MTTSITYTDVIRAGFPADLFRQWYALTYGATLLFGGSYDRWTAARRFAKHLARMIGSTPDAVIEAAKCDYLNSEYAE